MTGKVPDTNIGLCPGLQFPFSLLNREPFLR